MTERCFGGADCTKRPCVVCPVAELPREDRELVYEARLAGPLDPAVAVEIAAARRDPQPTPGVLNMVQHALTMQMRQD